MLADATDLSPQQCTAPSDHNRALAPKDFLFGAIHPHPRETGILQGTKLFQRNVQKILVLRGNQRTNEMVGGSVELLKVVCRIVPLIENQGDALTFLSEHLVASDEIVQNPAEGDRVVLVPFVDLREKRDMKIPGDQQRSEERRVGKECRSRWSRDH